MSFYAKRPPVVEAVQVKVLTLVHSPDEHSTWAHPGDYIVMEDNGNQRAVNQVVFEAYYAPVQDNPADVVKAAFAQAVEPANIPVPEHAEFSVGGRGKKK